MEIDRENEYARRLRECFYELDVILSNSGAKEIRHIAAAGFNGLNERLEKSGLSSEDKRWLQHISRSLFPSLD